MQTSDYVGVDIGVALCRTLREHVLDGEVESEHRQVTIGFLRFSGTDRLLRKHGPAVVQDALGHVIRATQAAAERNEVAFLATDVGADCIKVMLSAGAPRQVGHSEDRMIATLRAAIDAGGVLASHGGVATGRGFAGDFGPVYRRTYSVLGDCVNLAARLAEHAGTGELLASEDLVDAASGNVVATAKPTFAAKGKRAAVRPFSLTAPTTSSRGAGAPRTPMIGRREELATLLGAVRDAADGRGSAIEILGEPGMGKSTLLAELEAACGVDVVRTDGDVYATARPYAAFEQLVRFRWDLPASAPVDEVARHLEWIVSERAPHLLPWLPLISVVVGAETPDTVEVRQTDAAQRKQRLEWATSELMGRSLVAPTVLVFNDVQLMDDASRDLIDRLARDASDRRWLVVVSRRPDGESPLTAPGGQIELGPLSEEASTELLARATALSPLPPHRLSRVAERANGNPLFLHELVAQLRAGQAIEALPRSVEAAIAARIDRLAVPHRRTLRAAAVLGLDVDLPLLAELLADEERSASARLEDHLGALSEFLEPVGVDRHRFSHQLVREVAYESLPYRRRRVLHARTAAALERTEPGRVDERAELLSLHCLHGARYSAAWRWSLVAAEQARTRYAGAQAVDSYERALAAAAHVPTLEASELAPVDEAIGEILVELGEMRDAEAALRRALRRSADDSLAAARQQLTLARVREIEGRHAAAMRWVARAAATLADEVGADADILQGRLASRRARIRYRQGRHAEAMSSASVAIQLSRRGEDRRTLAEALEYLDLAAVELGVEAGTGAGQALAIYKELGALGDEARVRNTLGMLAYHHGAWDEALAHYRAAEDAYLRCGNQWAGATAMANAAEILVDQGRLEDAADPLERARRIYHSVGATSEVAFTEYQLGRVAARRGKLRAALGLLDSARGRFVAAGETTEVSVVDAFTAEARWLAGEHSEALALAEDTLLRGRSRGGVSAVTPLLHRVRGGALLALGRREEGGRALRDALRSARSRGADHETAFALGALLDAGIADDAARRRVWLDERGRLLERLGIERPDGGRPQVMST